MAPNLLEEPPQSPRSSDPSQYLRNPLPLSASQEAQVRDIYYKKVRSQCADEIKGKVLAYTQCLLALLRLHYITAPTLTALDFAACARNRTISLAWACSAQQFAMNSCMIAHSGPATEDAAREEWFSGVEDRRRKREEEAVKVEQRRKQIIDMTREQEKKEKAEMEAKIQEKEGKTEQKKGWLR